MDKGGSRDGASLSEEAPWRGPRGGGVSSLGTLKDMLKRAPIRASLFLGALF
jgi:hypothetical protein